ncbi:hypothetical protein E2C01_036674 [Portunus trituberculatus]|uniref:Uncharacterized protein n=1 Tax=Portunus trituberculatus TaxID=210409 RepID=A0A5B7FCQ9_PORTR|nr:hypothetical protein [Portunus trituberculatus]
MKSYLFTGFLDKVCVGDVEGMLEGGFWVGLILGVLNHVLVKVGSTVHSGIYPSVAIEHSIVGMWLLVLKQGKMSSIDSEITNIFVDCVYIPNPPECCACPYIKAIEGVKVVDDDMSVLHLPASIFYGKVTDGVVTGQLLHLIHGEGGLHLLDHSVGLAGDVLNELQDVISCRRRISISLLSWSVMD